MLAVHKLKTLQLDWIEQPVKASWLPDSITRMDLRNRSFRFDAVLPVSLRCLRMHCCIIPLTATSFKSCLQLQSLDLRMSIINQIPVGCLPPSLTLLLLPSYRTNPSCSQLLMGSLPVGLQRLAPECSEAYQLKLLQPLPGGLLPATLYWLQISRSLIVMLLARCHLH
jgi:hypothetical protein